MLPAAASRGRHALAVCRDFARSTGHRQARRRSSSGAIVMQDNGPAFLHACKSDDELAEFIKSTFLWTRPKHAPAGSVEYTKVLRMLDEAKNGDLSIYGQKSLLAALEVPSRAFNRKYSREVFNLFDEWDIAKCPRAYSLLMNPYSKHGDVETVSQLIRDMLAAGGRLTGGTYYMLVRALCARGHADEAHAIVQKMAGDPTTAPLLDAKLLTTLLEHSTTAEHVTATQRLLQRWKADKEAPAVYTATLRACATLRDPRRAEKIMLELKQKRGEKVPINQGMWHALMEVHAASCSVDGIRRLRQSWHRMVEGGFRPTSATYTVYIEAHHRLVKAKDDAHVIAAEIAFGVAMERRLVAPGLWAALLRCYEAASDFEKAFALLAVCPDAMRRWFPPDLKAVLDVNAFRKASIRTRAKVAGKVQIPSSKLLSA
ncbi:hypothetical protein DIPPA_02478 [Diplonema papillatum]|nr:hypothetical protein DIPPA_02478 [Diplonema papillatum]